MTPLLTWIWPESPIAVAVVAALALALNWLVRRAIRIAVESSVARAKARHESQGGRAARVLAHATGQDSARHEARTRAIGSVLRSVTAVAVSIIAVVTIMKELSIPIEPLLTAAGIGGVALGIGAQSLVKDYLSGIFLILEDQYGVGDLIDTGSVTGTVEDVGLRITRLRDMGGLVWYVRNGEIVRVGNRSQGWSTADVDIPVAYDEDSSRVTDLLNRVADEVSADHRWDDVLLERPSVAGVNEVRGGTMTLKVFAKCAPNQHWGVQRDILERSLQALRDAGIRGPIPQLGDPAGTSKI